MIGKRQPWHYDAFEGKPEWAVQLSRLNVMRRQRENLDQRRAAPKQEALTSGRRR